MASARSSLSRRARAHRARDLGHFDAVRQAGAKQVAFVIDEDLRLVLEAPKRRGMHDAIAVALELAAHLGSRLRMRAPPLLPSLTA
jgi:hypothetical protein